MKRIDLDNCWGGVGTPKKLRMLAEALNEIMDYLEYLENLIKEIEK